MRILTVRQPWAHAIFHGKDVENRTRNIVGDYRGPVAIHAALTKDNAIGSAQWEMLKDIWHRLGDGYTLRFGAIIGVVDLEGVHQSKGDADDCSRLEWWAEGGAAGVDSVFGCSAWADRIAWHLQLDNPRLLPEPIPYRGALGLRTLDEATAIRVWEAIA